MKMEILLGIKNIGRNNLSKNYTHNIRYYRPQLMNHGIFLCLNWLHYNNCVFSFTAFFHYFFQYVLCAANRQMAAGCNGRVEGNAICQTHDKY